MGGSVKMGLRIAAIALFIVLFLPVQWLAVRFGWRWSGALPLLFHRYALRVLGLKVVRRGTIAKSRHLLLTPNHVSWLDIIVLGSIAPMSFVAKAEVAAMPFFGMVSRLQRTVYVDRNRRSETADVNRSVAARLEAGDVMVLFAEGTTGDGTRVLPFRSALLGAARDAGGRETIVDLQPVALAYTKRGGLPLSASARASDISWIGDIELAPSLIGILKGAPIDVEVSFGETLAYGPETDRKKAARVLESSVRTMVQTSLRGA
jgi:lyso-ornithine lipid O-acyltransferase